MQPIANASADWIIVANAAPMILTYKSSSLIKQINNVEKLYTIYFERFLL